VAERLAAGRLRPASGPDLSAAVVTGIIRRMLRHLESLTAEVWELERTVTAGHFGDAEQFLEQMFRVRHGLLTVGTMAMLNHEVYDRMATVRMADVDTGRSSEDIVDQFARIATMTDGQRRYIQGVIEFYQTRTNTKMTIAAERLAVIAAVTLPITALSSVLGMDVIVNAQTEWGWLVVILAVMAAMSTLMLLWARRNGWW
jgi:magnesium transporter